MPLTYHTCQHPATGMGQAATDGEGGAIGGVSVIANVESSRSSLWASL